MKAGTQECGTERGTEDEHACAQCEGAHGYRRNHQVYLFAGSGATAKSVVSLSV